MVSYVVVLSVILVINLVAINSHPNGDDIGFPGVVELVENYRRSRVSKDFTNNNNNNKNVASVKKSPPISEINYVPVQTIADTSTADYEKFIQSDPKKLTDEQRQLLERIADRVARYGGGSILSNNDTVITLNETKNNDNDNNNNNGGGRGGGSDVTIKGIPTTTDTAETEGRANNKQSVNKNKTKSGTTRRPSSSTKAIQKRPTTSSPSSPSSSSINHNRSTVKPTINKINKTTGNNKINATPSLSSTPSSASISNGGGGIGTSVKRPTTSVTILNNRQPAGAGVGAAPTEVIYDYNVTATAIIESLSKDPTKDEIHINNRNRPQSESNSNNSNKKKTPQSGTAKPTKYHYYPHNQHIYLLPECAIQQVCNAVYVRLNYTQPLCACPSRYRDPCSASLNEDDLHTTKLIGDKNKKAITLAKTCESTTEMRECRAPKDWSLLALQNTRTGKSHYLVICRCPDHFRLDGPMAHDQPTYASVPGIRVFGMMCVKPGVSLKQSPSSSSSSTLYQPPKRYQSSATPSPQQHTKPIYTQPSHKFTDISRPASYQPQKDNNNYQPSQYQYLNRPGSPTNTNSYIYRDGPTQSPQFSNSGYRSIGEENPPQIDLDAEKVRSKRDINRNDEIIEADTPEFPWHRIQELRESLNWD